MRIDAAIKAINYQNLFELVPDQIDQEAPDQVQYQASEHTQTANNHQPNAN